MRTDRVRAMRWEGDSRLGPDLYKQVFGAQDASDAVAATKRIDCDLAELGADAVSGATEDAGAIRSPRARALPDPDRRAASPIPGGRRDRANLDRPNRALARACLTALARIRVQPYGGNERQSSTDPDADCGGTGRHGLAMAGIIARR